MERQAKERLIREERRLEQLLDPDGVSRRECRGTQTWLRPRPMPTAERKVRSACICRRARGVLMTAVPEQYWLCMASLLHPNANARAQSIIESMAETMNSDDILPRATFIWPSSGGCRAKSPHEYAKDFH